MDIDKIEQIDQLIRLKATGSPKEFAVRLNVSESTLYRYLNEMKERNAPILFDKQRNTYYYYKKGKFDTCFVSMEQYEMQAIKGGTKNIELFFALSNNESGVFYF